VVILAEEREVAIELIIGEYQILQELKPDHDLLRYITEVTSSSFTMTQDHVLQEDFLNKYAPGEKTYIAVMLSRYLVDLIKTNDDIQGTNRLASRDENPRKPQRLVNLLGDEDPDPILF
jgi:hypothetical protein